MNLKICVIEDEQQAGEKLISMIKAESPASTITWLRSIQEGKNYLNSDHQTDLIFSDIELLDGNVFTLYDEITPNCPIIFSTAYNNFYTDAFDTNGIAYLLKPYSKSQFKNAWEKYLKLFSPKEITFDNSQLLSAIQAINNQAKSNYKSTFTIKKRNESYLLKVEDILYFEADDDYVIAWDKQLNKHLFSDTLKNIEQVIDPQLFFKINRSELVNFHAIQKFEPYIKSRLAITLISKNKVLHTSNSRSAEFKTWLENH